MKLVFKLYLWTVTLSNWNVQYLSAQMQKVIFPPGKDFPGVFLRILLKYHEVRTIFVLFLVSDTFFKWGPFSVIHFFGIFEPLQYIPEIWVFFLILPEGGGNWVPRFPLFSNSLQHFLLEGATPKKQLTPKRLHFVAAGATASSKPVQKLLKSYWHKNLQCTAMRGQF